MGVKGAFTTDLIAEGSDVYLELDIPSGRECIDRIALSINGEDYGTETSWPYQWGKGFRVTNPSLMTNARKGRYSFEFTITETNGNQRIVDGEYRIFGDEAYDDPFYFYNFEGYGNGYAIASDPRWTALTNYRSPTVGGHNLRRKNSLEINPGSGVAFALDNTNRSYVNFGYYLYVPNRKESTIGFYDSNFQYD